MTPREEAERMAREAEAAAPCGYPCVSIIADALTPSLIKTEQANERIRVLTVDRDATQEAFEKMGARVVKAEAEAAEGARLLMESGVLTLSN